VPNFVGEVQLQKMCPLLQQHCWQQQHMQSRWWKVGASSCAAAGA
jgi:hypothetical protein